MHQPKCIKNKEKAIKNIDTQTFYDQRICDVDDELESRLNLTNFNSKLRNLETEFGLECKPNDEDIKSKTNANEDPEDMVVCDVGDIYWIWQEINAAVTSLETYHLQNLVVL